MFSSSLIMMLRMNRISSSEMPLKHSLTTLVWKSMRYRPRSLPSGVRNILNFFLDWSTRSSQTRSLSLSTLITWLVLEVSRSRNCDRPTMVCPSFSVSAMM